MHLRNEYCRAAMLGLRNAAAAFQAIFLGLLRQKPMASQMQLRVSEC